MSLLRWFWSLPNKGAANPGEVLVESVTPYGQTVLGWVKPEFPLCEKFGFFVREDNLTVNAFLVEKFLKDNQHKLENT